VDYRLLFSAVMEQWGVVQIINKEDYRKLELVHKVALLDRGGVTGNYITLRYTCCNDPHHEIFPTNTPILPNVERKSANKI